MATTPGALGRRYAPFLILAAVQVLLVAVVPSKGTRVQTGDFAAGTSGQSGVISGDAGAGTGAGAAGAAGTTGGTDAATGGGVAGASGGTAGAGGAGGNAAAAGGSGGGGGTAQAAGAEDRSRCAKNGQQIGPTFYMPACRPRWAGGDNGGATMTGVDATTVKYVFYRAQGNAQVNAILARQDLAASAEQFCEAVQAFDKSINKNYEMYGRKAVSLDGPGKNKGSSVNGSEQPNCRFPYFQGQCSLTPPDPPCERAEAQVIATQMKPAFVLAPVADPALYNELGKRGIVVIGGQNFPEQYHADLAPYYWDVFMDGKRVMSHLAEYYCKKLVGKPVKYAGREVLGIGTPPKRKVGVIYPSTAGDPTYKLSVDFFVSQITGGMCGSKADGVKTYSYESNINTAQQQATTTVLALKNDKITTVVCFCDPIAPVFLTNTMDAQAYHPEELTAGSFLMDYDKLARLYNPNVWKYAFGPSTLQIQLPFDQSDAARAWRDAGNTGLPDKTENLNVAYYNLMASMIQNAGPTLNPRTIQQGMFNAQGLGGLPNYPKIQFRAPSDYTGIDDDRETYWCATRPSEIDGQAGSYASVDNGKRTDLGQWTPGDPRVFPNGTCI